MTPEERNYSNVHIWLAKTYGKASKCENDKCENIAPKRYEWALKRGFSYEKNINNFLQLCPSCHRKYDYSEKQRNRMKEIAKDNHFTTKNPMKTEVGRKRCSEWMRMRVVSKTTKQKQSDIRKGKLPPYMQNGGLPSRCREVIDTKTGIIYKSLKEASIQLGVQYQYLMNNMRPSRKNKTNLKWTTPN